MSDVYIFMFGGVISFMVVLATFLFTFIEFRRMGRNPERFQLKTAKQRELDINSEKLDKDHIVRLGNG